METITEAIVVPLETPDTYKNEPHKLILWNDDFNSFDHVIGCLMLYLMKSALEAFQITTEVHLRGKSILLGASTKEELEPIYEILIKNKLTCSIE